MSKRKLTNKQKALRSEYNKQRNRIKRFVKRRAKQGFLIDESIIPQTVTQKGRITSRDIQRLKNITPEKIYSKSEFLDYETGEVVNAKRGKVLARKRQYINGEIIETYVEPLSFHYYNKVRNEIMEMENETFDLSEHKYGLLELMEEKYNDYYDEYDNYLKTVYPMIGVLINELNYDSHPLQINKHTGQLSKLLAYQQDGLTDEQAYRLAELTNSTVGDFL